MLDLEVVPERSLGCEQWEFVLGMHFSQSVAIIQSQVGLIKGVQVLYNDVNPLEVDLIINLPQDGIRLFFDPISQRLKVIEVFNMKLLKLKYCGLLFNSPEVLPTVEQIEHSFGATHPGVYDSEKQLFVLNFRGLSFYFPVETQYQASSTHNLGSLHFPPGSSPQVARLAIYAGVNVERARAPELPLGCHYGQLYLRKALVLRKTQRTCGLRLSLTAAAPPGCLMAIGAGGIANRHRFDASSTKFNFKRDVLLGQSAQDVTTAIGAPSRVFYKSEDKMRIHAPDKHHRRLMGAGRSDYFFNYFTLGIDILFDARTHSVKKLVLHTNYPGHYNFNMYQRCEFSADLNAVIVDAYSRWDELCKKLTPSERPVVLNRASSTNTTNPFGSTFCYGYQDIIFEVMPNNYIASLSIFGDGQPYSTDLDMA